MSDELVPSKMRCGWVPRGVFALHRQQNPAGLWAPRGAVPEQPLGAELLLLLPLAWQRTRGAAPRSSPAPGRLRFAVLGVQLCLRHVCTPPLQKPGKFLVRDALPATPAVSPGCQRVGEAVAAGSAMWGQLMKRFVTLTIVARWLPYIKGTLTVSLFHKLYQLSYTKKKQSVRKRTGENWGLTTVAMACSPHGWWWADIWIYAAKTSLWERRGSLLWSNALASYLYSQVSGVWRLWRLSG